MMMSCLSVLGSSAKNPGRFGWVIGVSRSRSPRMIIVGAAIFFGSVSVEVEEDAVRCLRTPLRDLLDPRLHRDGVGSRELEQTTRIVRRDRPELLGRRLAPWRAPHGRRVQNESPHLLRMLHGEEACDVGAPRPTEQMDFVNTAELADVIDDGVEVVGGDLCSDAETAGRSEEHTSELQSPCNLVCRLLLEKKKIK